MVRLRQEALTYLPLWKVVVILVVGFIISFSTPTWAVPRGPTVQRWDTIRDPYEKNLHTHIARKKMRSPGSVEDLERNRGNYQVLSSKEQDGLKRKRKQWEALPPEKQKVLRQRMKRLKELSPEDRELFRQRFNQWKRLSPKERRRIRQDLDRWESLPLQEREQIRRRFLSQ